MSRIISLALAALIAAVLLPVAASGSSDRSSSRDDSSSGTAGTVKSYTDGVLTIALNDGNELSGNVTGRTDIECDGVRKSRSSRHGDDDDKGVRRGDDHNKGERGDERSDGKRQGRRHGDDDCGDEALVAGAPVHKAKLKVSARGLAWDDVELGG